MSIIDSIRAFLKKLFGKNNESRSRPSRAASAIEAQEIQEEYIAKIDAVYNKLQDLTAEFQKAEAEEAPKHTLERLKAGAEKTWRDFQRNQKVWRSLVEKQELDEAASYAREMERIYGLPEGASARDIFMKVSAVNQQRREAAEQQEVLDEMIHNDQEERFSLGSDSETNVGDLGFDTSSESEPTEDKNKLVE